jgi:hypothetical protein
MDAMSVCAVWEEARCTVNSQRIILWHLKKFSGRKITVPEKEIRELKKGVLLPICNLVEINGENIHFWHRNINEVVLHRIKTEVMSRGFEKFKAMGYNQAYIVVSGDHGQRRFRAVIKFILCNNGNNTINPYSVVIRVGNIECRKDTREVLQKTIVPLLNDSLHLVVDKFIVIHYVNDVTNVILADEPPALNQDSEYSICLTTKSFMAGDLSF